MKFHKSTDITWNYNYHANSTTDSYGHQSRFSRPELPLLFQIGNHYLHEAEWAPFPNLVAPGIEPGTTVSVASSADHYTTEVGTNFAD
jgi:hypothetical protein